MKKRVITILIVCLAAALLTACGTAQTSAQPESEPVGTEEENRKPVNTKFFAEIAAERAQKEAGDPETEITEEETQEEEDIQALWPDSYKYIMNMNLMKR